MQPLGDTYAGVSFSEASANVVPLCGEAELEGAAEQDIFGSRTEGLETQGQSKLDHRKCPLKIDQPVVVFLNVKAVKGSVRYVGEDKDQDGQQYIVVGVELVSRYFNGVCTIYIIRGS